MTIYGFFTNRWYKNISIAIKKSLWMIGMGCGLWIIPSYSNAFSWHDLWIHPDHAAQKMMQKGEYAGAQQQFKREDWRATAAFRAGNYQDAATLFAALNQADGYYNAGNAYAHLGRYDDALKAYDKALALNQHNQDALDNRRIVEDLLKKQQQQQKQDQNKSDQNKNSQSKPDQHQSNSGKQDKNKDQATQPASDQNKQPEGEPKQENPSKDHQQKENSKQDKPDQNKPHESEQDKSEQDKSDQNKQNQQKSEKDEQNADQSTQQQSAQPDSTHQSKQNMEKQNMNQWLNMIPDDPGGLLREKFLRDYLRRRGES